MKKFALVGQHIDYTLSPTIHEIIRKHAGIEYEYDVVDCEPVDFDRVVEEKLKKEYDGFNVTKPYKVAISRHIDIVSDLIVKIGAANVVVKREHEGHELMIADNTDAYGFYRALEVGGMLPNENTNVLLLGAGGAARAAALILNEHCKLTVCNRSIIRAREMADEMKLKAETVVTEECAGKYDLIVNATTLGLDGENCLPEGVELEGATACFDMIYNPKETPFLHAARELGIKFVANGLVMLAAQAIRSVEMWFNKPIEIPLIQAILKEVLAL